MSDHLEVGVDRLILRDPLKPCWGGSLKLVSIGGLMLEMEEGKAATLSGLSKDDEGITMRPLTGELISLSEKTSDSESLVSSLA